MTSEVSKYYLQAGTDDFNHGWVGICSEEGELPKELTALVRAEAETVSGVEILSVGRAPDSEVPFTEIALLKKGPKTEDAPERTRDLTLDVLNGVKKALGEAGKEVDLDKEPVNFNDVENLFAPGSSKLPERVRAAALGNKPLKSAKSDNQNHKGTSDYVSLENTLLYKSRTDWDGHKLPPEPRVLSIQQTMEATGMGRDEILYLMDMGLLDQRLIPPSPRRKPIPHILLPPLVQFLHRTKPDLVEGLEDYMKKKLNGDVN